MQNPLPPSEAKKNKPEKLIVIAIVTSILLIAIVSGIILTRPGGGVSFTIGNRVTPEFTITTAQSSGTVVQGDTITTKVYIDYVEGDAKTVTLSADSGSSGIHCSFDPSSGSPSYTSTLRMNVPSYTSTKPYSVTITASNGEVSHSTSYTVSVLSAKVSVSGTVTTTGVGTNPSEIKFVDTKTGITYTGTLSGNYYSVTLDNQRTYAVTVTWTGLLWSTGTFSGGNLYVYAPVGHTSQSQDFSG